MELTQQLQKWCDEKGSDTASIILSVAYVKRIIEALRGLDRATSAIGDSPASRERIKALWKEAMNGIAGDFWEGPFDPASPPPETVQERFAKLLMASRPEATSATETTQDPVALSEAAILKALYASGLGVRPFIYESCKDGICIDRTTVQVDNFVKAIIKLVAPACTVPEERRIPIEVRLCCMTESNGAETWCVFLARAVDATPFDCLQVYADPIKGRAEYEADRLRQFFGQGPEPDLLKYDTATKPPMNNGTHK